LSLEFQRFFANLAIPKSRSLDVTAQRDLPAIGRGGNRFPSAMAAKRASGDRDLFIN
jgi:hypothetical protein